METQKPIRPWDVEHLKALGQKEGVKANYLKAIPVIILEKWVRGGRIEGTANFISTNEVAKRLEESSLRPNLGGKRNGVLFGSLSVIQNSRNLKNPCFIEYINSKGDSMFKIRLPHYEPVLEAYRRWYLEKLPVDYKKLFPNDEPQWETHFPSSTKLGSGQIASPGAEPERQDDIPLLLERLEQALRAQQQVVERITEENQRLQNEIQRMADENPGLTFVCTSPNFPRSVYGRRITSIKDTIAGMLDRAEYAVRISARQMDMFTDELIGLKQKNPEIEITIVSRKEQMGDRKRIAVKNYKFMKEAGIKIRFENELLHSRFVVIDCKEALVSSADLDYTHMEEEYNAGIWTNNPPIVNEVIRFFDNMLITCENS